MKADDDFGQQVCLTPTVYIWEGPFSSSREYPGVLKGNKLQIKAMGGGGREGENRMPFFELSSSLSL